LNPCLSLLDQAVSQ